MTQLLKDFGVSVPPSALLSCDNQAIIHITTNPTFHERTKHKEIDCYFVHDQVTVRLLKLMPVRTHHQLADIFTKLLPSSLLLPHLSKKAVQAIHCPSWGRVLELAVRYPLNLNYVWSIINLLSQLLSVTQFLFLLHIHVYCLHGVLGAFITCK